MEIDFLSDLSCRNQQKGEGHSTISYIRKSNKSFLYTKIIFQKNTCVI